MKQLHVIAAIAIGLLITIGFSQSLIAQAGAPAAPINVNSGTWISHGPEAGTIQAIAASPFTPALVWAGTTNGAFKSSDGAASWTPITSGLQSNRNVRDFAFDPGTPAIMYAAVNGGVYRSADGSHSWAAVNNGLTNLDVYRVVVHPQTPTLLFAGTYGGLFKSTNSGLTWTLASTGLTNTKVYALVIHPVTPSLMYAGTGSGLFKSTSGGDNWTYSSAGAQAENRSVKDLIISPLTSTLLYASFYPNLYRSVDGGNNWSLVQFNLYIKDLAIDPLNANTLYFASESSGLHKSTNSGVTWTGAYTGLLNFSVLAVTPDPHQAGRVFAGMGGDPSNYNGGGLYKSLNGGSTWQPSNHGLLTSHSYAVAIDPQQPNIVYGSANGAGVFRSADRGLSWTAPLTPGASLYVRALAINPATPATLYAGTWGSGLLKSTNSGVTWTLLSGGLPNNVSALGLAIDPLTPATVYAGNYTVNADRFYKSVNGGATWMTASVGITAPYVSALAINPISTSMLYVGTQNGVFRSLDGAASWQYAGVPQTILSLAVHPHTPTLVLAGTNGSGVYLSTDGGAQWSPANSGLPAGTNVHALAIDSENDQVYAGTTSGVYVKPIGGGSWTALNAGLDVKNVRALAIDPQLPGQLYASTLGGGIYVWNEVTWQVYVPLALR